MDHLSRLAQPSARFDGDTGEADELTRRALAGASDHVGYIRALVALCTSRLLMPIVATGDETMSPDPDRHAEMAAVTVSDGQHTALLAFTGVDSMQAWQSDARPILCHLDELRAVGTQQRDAVAELDAVVVQHPHDLVRAEVEVFEGQDPLV